ncbi:MAG: monovalent cation/H(+) antiporter subunit G [Planctomycetota bacterium]
MSEAVDVLSWVLLVSGGVASVVAGIGALRMPDLFSRMHAASILDTLAPAAVLSGLILQAGWTVVAFKLFLVFCFLAITTSTAAHALARSALTYGEVPVGVDEEQARRIADRARAAFSGEGRAEPSAADSAATEEASTSKA